MFLRPIALASAAGLALLVCCAAFADNYTYKRVRADDAAAGSAMIRKADFPTQLRLSGGRVKPDESFDSDSCNGYRPKEKDLVVTGDAEAKFHDPSHAVVVDSQVELFRSTAMAAADVERGQRMLSAACQAEAAKQEHVTLVSYRLLGHPTCTCDFGITALLETKTPQANLDELTIVTAVRKGRYEAAVITNVGKSTTDPQGGRAAAAAALGVQGLAVKAVLTRLHAT